MSSDEKKAAALIAEFEDTSNFLGDEFSWYRPKLIAAIAEALAEEREACAQLAESAFLYSDVRTSKASSERIAAAIRSRNDE